MATLAELGMVVSVSGLKQGLDAATGHFRKFHEETNKSAEIVRKGWETVKLALEAIAAVETVRKILEVTDAFRKMELQLTAIVGSASGGRDALRWVEEFASKTPYSLQTVTKAFQVLWSAGINPTTGSLQALADANAAMGGTDQSLQQLVGTIALIKDKGIVSLRELQRTLQNELPGAARIMAAQMGMSLDELARRVKAGAVSSEQAIAALIGGLQQQFGGQALAQMHTFAGAWKELHEEIEQLLRALGEAGITELAIRMIHALSEAVKHLREHVGEARDSVLHFLEVAEQWITENQNLVVTIVAAVAAFAAFQVVIGILTALGSVLLTIATILTGPAGLVALAVAAFVAWQTNAGGIRNLMTALWDWLLAGWQRFWLAAQSGGDAFLYNLKHFFSGEQIKIGDAIQGAWNASSLQTRMADDVSAMLATPIMQNVMKALDAIQKGWGDLKTFVMEQDIFGTAMAGVKAIVDQIGHGIGNVRAVLAEIKTAQDIKKAQEGAAIPPLMGVNRAPPWGDIFSNDLRNIFSGTGDFLTNIKILFSDTGRFLVALKQLFGEQGPLGDLARAFGHQLLSKFGQPGAAIQAGMSGYAAAYSGAAKTAGAAALAGGADAAASAVAGVEAGSAAGPWGAVIAAVMKLIEDLNALMVFINQSEVLWKNLARAFDPLISSLTEISNIFSEIIQVVIAVIRPLAALIAQILTPLLAGIARALQQVLGWFGIRVDRDSMSALAVLAQPSVTLRLDASQAMQELQRAQDAILAAGNDTQREAARQVFLSARAAAILAQQNLTPPVTPAFPEATIGGGGGLLDALGHLWDQLAAAWRHIADQFTGGLGHLWDQLSEGLRHVWEEIGNSIGWLWGQFTGGLTNLANQIGAFLGNVWRQLSGGLEHLGGQIGESIGFLWGEMNKFIRPFLEGIWLILAPILDMLIQIRNILSGREDLNVPGDLGKYTAQVQNTVKDIFGRAGIHAEGTNLTAGGLALLHDYEAVLPSKYNPSSPVFDPAQFWRNAGAAPSSGEGNAGGGQTIVIVVDSQGNVKSEGDLNSLSQFATGQVYPAMQLLERRRFLPPGSTRG